MSSKKKFAEVTLFNEEGWAEEHLDNFSILLYAGETLDGRQHGGVHGEADSPDVFATWATFTQGLMRRFQEMGHTPEAFHIAILKMMEDIGHKRDDNTESDGIVH